MHHFGIFRLRRRFASRMRSGFDEQAHRAASQKLRIYDARCASYIRRDIEVVITRRSWKPFADRHVGSNPTPSAKKIHRFAVDFFIQSAGLVWHQRTCALYGIATKSRMASRFSVDLPADWFHTSLCDDSIQGFALIPCRNKLRILFYPTPLHIF